MDADNSDEIIMNTDEMIEAKLNALKEQVPTGLPKQFNKEWYFDFNMILNTIILWESFEEPWYQNAASGEKWISTSSEKKNSPLAAFWYQGSSKDSHYVNIN